MFHLCSHGSRDIRRGAQSGLARPHALRQRLPRKHQVDAEMRLSQAAGPRDARRHAGPKLSPLTAGEPPHVPGVWQSQRDGRIRAAQQCEGDGRVAPLRPRGIANLPKGRHANFDSHFGVTEDRHAETGPKGFVIGHPASELAAHFGSRGQNGAIRLWQVI